MGTINHRTEIRVIGLILIISAIFSAGIGIKRHGDDSSYYSMIESFLKDGDFILGDKDLARTGDNELQIMPNGAYVIIDKKGVMKYAKPVLYPLIAAPFFFLGIRGFALLNGLFLGGGIILTYLFLRRHFNKNNSLFIAAMFFLCSFMPVYVSWINPQMMLFFACSLSMWLWLYKDKPELAALIMGIISTLRIEFLLLFALLTIVLAFWKKFKELAKAIPMYLLGYGLILFITFLFLGEFSPYSGKRCFIPGRMGRPYLTLQEVRDALIITRSMFEGSEFNNLELFLRNTVNFFIGRFTGIIWYVFPAVVCAVIYFLCRRTITKKEKILGDTILLVMLSLAIILVIARPLNYFGGRDFVGNRYLSVLPALLFLPGIKAVKRPASIALLFLPGLIISSQIIINEIFIKEGNRRHYAHTIGFPLKYAPLEIAQVESFMTHNIRLEVRDNLFLYTPSGRKMQDGKKILLNTGQEVVAVRDNDINDVVLTSGYGTIILQPRIVLKNKISGQRKSFYYFKAARPIWINFQAY